MTKLAPPHLADQARPGRSIKDADSLTVEPTEEQGRFRPDPRRRAYRGTTKFLSPMLQARNRGWLAVKRLFSFETDVALAEFLNRKVRTVRDAMAWCEANPEAEDDGRECPADERLPEGFAYTPATARELLDSPINGVDGPTFADHPESAAFIAAHTVGDAADDD